jgi:hypothetical protein
MVKEAAMRTRTVLILVVLAALCAAHPARAQDKFPGGSSTYVPRELSRMAVNNLGYDTWCWAFSSAATTTGAYSDTVVIRRDLNHNKSQAGDEIIPISLIQVIFRGAGSTSADSLRLRIHNTYSPSDTTLLAVSMNIYNQVITLPIRCAYVCIKAKKSGAAAKDFMVLGFGQR